MIKPYSNQFTIDYSNERLSNVFALQEGVKNTGHEQEKPVIPAYEDDLFKVGDAYTWTRFCQWDVKDSLIIATAENRQP